MTHTPPHEPPELAGRRILLGLTGSVACYKAAELCRLLTQAGARVQVAMSEGAQHFITAATMQALSGQPVFTSQWDERPANGMAHIQLGREADAILVAPASADFLARLAAGRADDLLSLLCLARPRERAPLLLAPAMNREMWSHPATQRNVRQAAADGARVLAVGFGAQACGETGDGRMLQAPELLEEVIAALTPQTLAGRRVVVTAGPTFEAIDPVRGLTNRSSGKMGFAIARAARLAGAQVTLIAGPVHLPTPHGVARVDVESALQMQAALQPAANDDAGAAACPSSPAPRQPRQNRRAAASAARAAHLSVPAAPPAPHPHHAPARNVINRWAKRGMLLTLGASLALAATGAKRGHAALGGVFVLLLGVHLAVHRRRLLK